VPQHIIIIIIVVVVIIIIIIILWCGSFSWPFIYWLIWSSPCLALTNRDKLGERPFSLSGHESSSPNKRLRFKEGGASTAGL
jgi:uncharacterized SAM-binding protein YcdF (DUF218 family)